MLPPYPAVVPCVKCCKPVEELRKCYAHPTCYACLPPPAPLPVAAISLGTFQRLVGEWAIACFGEDVAYDTTLRNHRFLEEALELVQSLGCTANEAHRVVEYVFHRPVGEPAQELGGVMVTLATLCNAQVRLAAADPNRAPLHMQEAATAELGKNWDKLEKIREKSKNKPRFDQPEPGAAWATVEALAAHAQPAQPPVQIHDETLWSVAPWSLTPAREKRLQALRGYLNEAKQESSSASVRDVAVNVLAFLLLLEGGQ